MKSQAAQPCPATGHLYGTDGTQECPTEPLKAMVAPLSYVSKLEWGRPASWPRQSGIIRGEKEECSLPWLDLRLPISSAGRCLWPQGKMFRCYSREVDVCSGSDAGFPSSKYQGAGDSECTYCCLKRLAQPPSPPPTTVAPGRAGVQPSKAMNLWPMLWSGRPVMLSAITPASQATQGGNHPPTGNCS